MNIDWVMVIYSAILVGILLSMSRVWALWESRISRQVVDKDAYRNDRLFARADRTVYGHRVLELCDDSDEFHDSIEICDTQGGAYTRILIDFPTHLRDGVTLMTEGDEGMVKRFLHLRETKIGHEAFDSQFLILSPSQERAEELISQDFRRRIIDLRTGFDELKISPEGLFLQAFRALPPNEMQGALESALSIVRDFYDESIRLEEEEKLKDKLMVEQAEPS